MSAAAARLDDLSDVRRVLAERLAGGLPGGVAQARLAPRPREGWMPDRVPDDARDGGALVLLYPSDGIAHVLLTLRDGGLALHAGQVSLPGGGLRHDETTLQAALREAREETAVDPATLAVLGELSPLHIPVSEYVVHPVVATTDRRPAFRAQAGEVARIIEARLADLADPSHLRVDSRTFRGTTFRVPWLEVDGERLWGATAMILAELLVVLGHPPADWD